jgi:acyl-CoA synthetase (AMP-forming)/AMP-acid ligase II
MVARAGGVNTVDVNHHQDRDQLELSAANAIAWTSFVRRHAHVQPADVALRSDGSGVTYQELDVRFDRIAAAFSRLGVTVGGRVGILMANRTEYIEALGGIMRLGAIAVPLNFRLVAAEVAHLLHDSGAALLLVDAERADIAQEAVAAAGVGTPIVVVGDQAPSGSGYGWADILEDAPAPPPLSGDTVAAWEPAAPAAIMYTSGTTGRPKGAVLTHLNLLMSTMAFMRTTRSLGNGGTSLCAAPIFHIAGLAKVVPALTLGQTVVLPSSRTFDPPGILDLLESERVTDMFLVPTQWQAMCDLPDIAERSLHLRAVTWGASPALPSTMDAMARSFPDVPFTAVFGQTEMSPVTCVLDGEDATRKFGSVGLPVPAVDIRVVDEEMRDVENGRVGEIVYRGPSMMARYWNNPEATGEATRGGWFHSGDLVRRDDDGFVFVVDRKKDMIISGGENIYSTEIEDVIDSHPKVGEVAVIGVPHPRWVETPLAVIVPSDPDDPPTEDDVEAWCRERLASYKKPSAIRIVDALPRNVSGKVLKTDLRVLFGGEVQQGTSG